MPTDATEGGTDEDSILAEPAVRGRLRPLPPSSKLVALVLADEPGLGQNDLVERSLWPPRTVWYGLIRLEEAHLVATRPSLQDARKLVYFLQH